MSEQENSTGFLEKLFYFIIPIMFVLLLSVTTLHLLGVFNVKGPLLTAGKNIPIISSLIPEYVEGDEEAIINELETNLNESQFVLEQKEADLEAFENVISDLEQQNSLLMQQIDELEEGLSEQLLDEDERLEQLLQLANIYTDMSASNAADILAELTLHEAALIIMQMNANDKSQIIASMEPQVAADITMILKDFDKVQDLDMYALQERNELLMSVYGSDEDGSNSTDNMEINTQQLIDSFNQMPIAEATLLVEDMGRESMGSPEFELGLRILSQVTDDRRSALLGQMESEISRKYLRELAS